MTSFTIPESVKTLGTTVFWFAGLTSLNIPAGVTSIGQALFCSSPVATVTVDAGNAKYADLGCNGIFEKATNRLVAGGAATTIPDGITTIGEEAFWGEEGEFSLFLPESVTAIEERAFHMASGLKTLTIPSGITYIDGECFAFCEGTQNVYCYVDADDMTWDDGMSMAFSMMTPKGTKFHVTDADAWSTKFPDANVTFVGDLAPAIAGNAVDGVYWATYYNSAANMKADANTTVYKAAINGSSLTLTEVADKVINAGEAVILKSKCASIAMTTSAAASTADYTGNALEGFDVATAVAAGFKYYVLSNENSTLGFYRYNGATLGANKAFIKVADAGAPAYFSFNFGGEPTGITNTNRTNNTNISVVYNLSGQRVAQPTKGLYIVNGKTVVIK